jgi:hypothetical protein
MSIATKPAGDVTVRVPSSITDPYTPAECRSMTKALIDQLFTTAERHRMTEEAAYYRAERRGFEPGHELDDWLWAEHEVNAACGLIEPFPRWDNPS